MDWKERAERAEDHLEDLREFARSLNNDDLLDEVIESIQPGGSIDAPMTKEQWKKVDERYPEVVEQRILQLAFCRDGHEFIDDQCGIPSHKFCVNCRKGITEEELAAL